MTQNNGRMAQDPGFLAYRKGTLRDDLRDMFEKLTEECCVEEYPDLDINQVLVAFEYEGKRFELVWEAGGIWDCETSVLTIEGEPEEYWDTLVECFGEDAIWERCLQRAVRVAKEWDGDVMSEAYGREMDETYDSMRGII